MLVSREDWLPCPGSSMLLGSLHSCFLSSPSVPCHLCAHTDALRCPWLRRRRGVMQSEFSVGVGARLCWGGHSLCSPSFSVSVCAVLCCQHLLALLGFFFAFPCALLGLGSAQGQRGARGVTSQPLPGLTVGAPLPSPCSSSYLFIQMSKCDEVQKSKLAPERP